MFPYKDKALETYKKIIFYPYETNKIYLFRENIYFYVNQKNYMHFIMIDSVKYKGKKHYYISFKKLTTNNLLEETGRDAHIYETIPLALIRLEKIVREAKEIPSKGFCQRRINDAEKTIRAQNRNIEHYKKHIEEYPQDNDTYTKYIDNANEIIETNIEKAAYYDALLQQQGGIIDRKSLKKGMIVNVEKWGKVRYLRGGSKNITFEFLESHMVLADGTPMQGQVSYAEIKEIVKEV